MSDNKISQLLQSARQSHKIKNLLQKFYQSFSNLRTQLQNYAGAISLRNKLVILNVLATVTALGITFIIVTYIQVRRARKELVREMKTVVQLFADNVVNEKSFVSHHDGIKTLVLIKPLELVHEAVLFNKNGKEVARFERTVVNNYKQEDSFLQLHEGSYSDDYLHTVVPVSREGIQLGMLSVRTSTHSLNTYIFTLLLQFIIILGITAALSTYAAIKFQAIILAPILYLGEVMRKIVVSHDYSIRVEQKSNDETGMLYIGFNTMLDHIQDRERNLELVNFDLQLERYRAEAASQSKSEFLAKMSHEIRTPLNGILSLADLMLMEEELSSEQKDDLDTIRMSAHSLKTIINDVLDFSKIEAGRLILESTSFSLRTLIEDTVKILSIESRNANQNLVCAINSSIPEYLLGDPTRIQQILTNLIANAIKFTPQGGGIIVHVDAKLGDNGNVTIHLGIADTGIGIPKSKYNAIFDSFTQADDSTTRRYGGTGLGLTICKRLVKMMQGQIWLESKVDTGTTFHVMLELPLDQNNSSTDNTLSKDIKEDDSESMKDEYIRVLIAEDNEINSETLTRFLKLQGFIPFVVSNGLEAIKALETKDFDIILMDLQMPLMGGIEATRYIRESEFNSKDIPIIAVTADAIKGNETICLAAGMDGFITKPIDYPQLFNIMREKVNAHTLGNEKAAVDPFSEY
jgi:two-component system, sensor histidine kinase